MIIKSKPTNAGTINRTDVEPRMSKVNFSVHKFTDRPRPAREDVVVVCAFSEFGCETLVPLYCLPRLREQHPGKYFIVAGWYGREYFYRHLADEFWELNEENQFLREYTRAFHHVSKNLEEIETNLANFGQVVTAQRLGHIAAGNHCRRCGQVVPWRNKPVCQCNAGVEPALFADVAAYKRKAVRLPPPSEKMLSVAGKYLGKNPVGIFARNRKTYGRNLRPEFYTGLVALLESMGHTPIWLGEKQSTLPCPVSHVLDFSRLPESRDLELTLAIVSKLDFTVQFWTASTRLAGMMGVPFLLFESPEQIVGNFGQEGLRLELTTFGNYKLVYSHYLKVLHDNPAGLELVRRAVEQMREGDWRDVMGLIDEPDVVRGMVHDKRGARGLI
jgi:hypothetical protein